MISVSHKQITAGLSPAVVLTGVVSLPAGAGKGRLVHKPWYCQEFQSCLPAQEKAS